MYESLAEKLRCPQDLNHLELRDCLYEPDGHIWQGNLYCSRCGRRYPIEYGVPNMVPSDTSEVAGQNFGQLQAETMKRFGFEWQYYDRWGWIEELPDVPNAKDKFTSGLLEISRKTFWSKSLFFEDELHAGVVMLDAGCGNGRHVFQAAQTGAEVIGVDLGQGGYSAFKNTRHLPNVHIVRGDLLRLPFADATFDLIYSIGVLQHTGNASAAFDSLARTLAPQGLIVAHVYGTGYKSYEILDKGIRAITTRLPIQMQMGLSKAAANTAAWLRRGGKLRTKIYWHLFYRFIPLWPTQIQMYDWWAAPIATHHSLAEVKGWFVKNQIQIERARPALDDAAGETLRRQTHGEVTVLGRRSAG